MRLVIFLKTIFKYILTFITFTNTIFSVEGCGIMTLTKKILALVSVLCIAVFVIGCNPVDNDYGVVSDTAKEDTPSSVSQQEHEIMSSDRVVSKYFDISLFDEENYADIYLGKKFKIDATYAGEELKVPTKIEDLEKNGWKLAEGNTYDKNSLVFAYETIDAVIQNKDGLKIAVQFYNSSRSSVKLSKCYIVKYRIENDFYANPESYSAFDISGIKNTMAITDIINTLGTPSHFYKVSDSSYYFDYFITQKDRRNGITIYVNPLDDSITSIEFSYYK